MYIGHQGVAAEGDYYAILTNDSGSVQTDTVSVTVRHNLNLAPERGGSITAQPDQDLYDHQTEVELTAVPNPGFVFKDWLGALEGGDPSATITMDYSKSAIARFTDVEFPELTVNETFPAVTKVPEFTLTGSTSDNDRVVALTYVLNNGWAAGVPVDGSDFSLTVPLEFGENTLVLKARDYSGLETVTSHIISWEPDHYWTVEAPQAVGEAGLFEAAIYLGSPGDVAGANFTLSTNPTCLSYLGFKPAKALSRTFQTVSEEDGVMNLTFASLGRTIPAGKTLIGLVYYRVRSLPGAVDVPLTFEEVDLADSSGSPFEELSGIRSDLVSLEPRSVVGDINNNGRYDSGDAQYLQRLLGGLEEARPWDGPLNDVNGSGGFDIGDIIVVLQTAAGIQPQPSSPEARSRTPRVSVEFNPEAPMARIELDPPFASPGTVVKAKIVVDGLTSDFGGATFTVTYPVEALRLLNEDSHRVGSLQPDSSLHLWNVGPTGFDYENQDGTISFAAGSAEDWPGSGAGGVIAEFDFVVQEAAGSKGFWPLVLTESEVSVDGGLTVTGCNLESAVFVGQPLDWAAWRSANFSPEEMGNPEISGRLADPDKDGHGNELEFFLGTNPKASDAGEAMKPIWIETQDGGVHFGLEVNRDPRVTGLVPSLEWSDDLSTWNSSDAGGSADWWAGVTKDAEEPGKIILMDLREESSPAGYLRLKLK